MCTAGERPFPNHHVHGVKCRIHCVRYMIGRLFDAGVNRQEPCRTLLDFSTTTTSCNLQSLCRIGGRLASRVSLPCVSDCTANGRCAFGNVNMIKCMYVCYRSTMIGRLFGTSRRRKPIGSVQAAFFSESRVTSRGSNRCIRVRLKKDLTLLSCWLPVL